MREGFFAYLRMFAVCRGLGDCVDDRGWRIVAATGMPTSCKGLVCNGLLRPSLAGNRGRLQPFVHAFGDFLDLIRRAGFEQFGKVLLEAFLDCRIDLNLVDGCLEPFEGTAAFARFRDQIQPLLEFCSGSGITSFDLAFGRFRAAASTGSQHRGDQQECTGKSSQECVHRAVSLE